MENLRVAPVQLDIPHREPGKNLDRAINLIKSAPGADLYLLPELFTTGFSLKNARETAKEGPKTLADLASLAREMNAAVAGSILHPFGEGAANTGFFVDRDGTILPFYRKAHLFGPMGEDKHLLPGREVRVFETSLGPVGMAICYDLRFPEMIRRLTLSGMKLLLVPAQWPDARKDHWRTLLRARAIENGIFAIGANRVGAHGEYVFPGLSSVIDPWGETLLECGGEEAVSSAVINYAKIDYARSKIPALRDRIDGVDGP